MASNKLPAITAAFWITKILTTGMGETTSDFLVHQIDPPVAVASAGVALLGALVLQFALRRYVAWAYWLAVVMVSIFGTMVADVVHVQFGVPYLVSTIGFAIVLGAVFTTWFLTQGTLSIHAVDTRARESLYWAAVMATFALGTAAGDLFATTLMLGYLAAGVIFAVMFAVPGVAHRLGILGATAAFWSSYILTRPLGASFADWVALPPERGGLGVGAGAVSAVLALAVIAMVAYLGRRPSVRPAIARISSRRGPRVGDRPGGVGSNSLPMIAEKQQSGSLGHSAVTGTRG